MNSTQRSNSRMIAWIMLGLAVWGFLLGIGAYLGLWFQTTEEHGLRNPARLLVVLGATAFYLLFWSAALAIRRRRLQREPDPRRTVPPPYPSLSESLPQEDATD